VRAWALVQAEQIGPHQNSYRLCIILCTIRKTLWPLQSRVQVQISTYVLQIIGKPTLPSKLTRSILSGCDILMFCNCHFLPSLFFGVNQLIFSTARAVLETDHSQKVALMRVCSLSTLPGPKQPFNNTSPGLILTNTCHKPSWNITSYGNTTLVDWNHVSGYFWCSKQNEK